MAKKTASSKKKSTKTRPPRKKTATSRSKTTTKATKARSRSAKSASSKSGREVSVDRRRQADRRSTTATEDRAPKIERRKKVNRRRQIDPTTCERDYTTEEVEFMNALDDYKRASGRMFPTCSEILEVVRSLGYVKAAPADVASTPLPVSQQAGAAATTEESVLLATPGEAPDEPLDEPPEDDDVADLEIF